MVGSRRFWIKLFIELLDDPKMGLLPDALWRRVVEMFLLAGENDEEGRLPSLEWMAWRLRRPAEELEADLTAIADRTGIVEHRRGAWWVTSFAERQAPLSTERVRRHRTKRSGNVSETRHETLHETPEAFPETLPLPLHETESESESESEGEREGEREGEGERELSALALPERDPWQRALEFIRETYFPNVGRRVNFDRYFARTRFGGWRQGSMVVVCESSDVLEWLSDSRPMGIIRNAAFDKGEPVKVVLQLEGQQQEAEAT